MFNTLTANLDFTGYEYGDEAFAGTEAESDFCTVTDAYDPLSGAPIVQHAEPCACVRCLLCGFVAPYDLGWHRTPLGDFICPADHDDDITAAF